MLCCFARPQKPDAEHAQKQNREPGRLPLLVEQEINAGLLPSIPAGPLRSLPRVGIKNQSVCVSVGVKVEHID
jgi:hypothetical protein